VGLVHSPALADRQLAPAADGRKHRQHLHRPAMNRRVIDHHPAFGHHLLSVAQAQRVGHVPAYAHQHDFRRKVQPLDRPAQSSIIVFGSTLIG
jgi:hypothetical protein